MNAGIRDARAWALVSCGRCSRGTVVTGGDYRARGVAIKAA